ncbi:DEAD/DEAH box helicase [Actinomycetospora chiangmaiensis]|uniref:DEAD/DEAH box helicase n=1 Tax=Actinomycetospora chiangmaiensis TaxID=402650 RepID=UPI00035EC515|nr:DEAD/DEAH box helicase [Actinomycetospora chiangmaiensis]
MLLISDITTFTGLGISPSIAELLAPRGITEPTPIQAAAIPDALAGRDVLGRGRTGSGKTLAFGLPVLAKLARCDAPTRPNRPRALILLPTRELASQVRDALAPLSEALGLEQTVVYGGVGQRPQENALRRGVDLLIACPGRLEDLIGQGILDLDRVEVTVLDEADHMSDLGFLPAVRRLLRRTPTTSQRLLFSATLDGEVDKVVREFLRSPVTHSVDRAAEPVPDMTHHVFTVQAADRAQIVQELAGGLGRTMLFTRTKHAARKLSRKLAASGIPAAELHGNLAQNARDRNLGWFRDGEVRVLVATDIAARGIHVDDVALVVHVDPPAEHKAYLHRSGRTARAGSAGDVVTLAAPDQRSDVAKLTRQAGIKPRTAQVTPGSREIRDLVGEPAPPAEMPAVESAPQESRPSSGSSSRSGRPRRRGGRGGAPQATGQNAGGQAAAGGRRRGTRGGNGRSGQASATSSSASAGAGRRSR